MIPKDEPDKAVGIAKKYRVGKLYLIGSALYKEPKDVSDYDFAVPVGKFFKFYGELLRVMSKNADLIDLSGNMTKFKNNIAKEGKLIYAKTSTLRILRSKI